MRRDLEMDFDWKQMATDLYAENEELKETLEKLDDSSKLKKEIQALKDRVFQLESTVNWIVDLIKR